MSPQGRPFQDVPECAQAARQSGGPSAPHGQRADAPALLIRTLTRPSPSQSSRPGRPLPAELAPPVPSCFPLPSGGEGRERGAIARARRSPLTRACGAPSPDRRGKGRPLQQRRAPIPLSQPGEGGAKRARAWRQVRNLREKCQFVPARHQSLPEPQQTVTRAFGATSPDRRGKGQPLQQRRAPLPLSQPGEGGAKRARAWRQVRDLREKCQFVPARHRSLSEPRRTLTRAFGATSPDRRGKGPAASAKARASAPLPTGRG